MSADDVLKYQEYFYEDSMPQPQRDLIRQCRAIIKHLAVDTFEGGIGFEFEDNDWIIAGGFPRAVLLGQKPADVDIYLTNEKILTEFKVQVVKDVGKGKHVVSWKSNKGINYDVIIGEVFPTPRDVLSTYDIVASECAITHDTITHHKDYWADLATRTITFDNLREPMNTVIRLQKYVGYGFKAPIGELHRLATAMWDLENQPEIPPHFIDAAGEIRIQYRDSGNNIPF